MAIGTAAAIGLGVAGVGSALGASAQKKAANKAADTSLAVARENNALADRIYGKNEGYLSPYATQGLGATALLNDFLGIPGQMAAPQALPTTPTGNMPAQTAVPQFSTWHADNNGDGQFGFADIVAYKRGQQAQNGPVAQVAATQQPNALAAVTPGAGRNAFANYIANSDYGFQFGQGANRVNSGYAGAGTLQSGAAMKALEDYRQNLQSGYRGEYLNLLGNQQGVGLSGASALAGVGQNYVNTISANNNNAGTAAANAALIKGANNPFANALSLVGGGLFGLGR